jgi:4'-phosphopantetheinyl transferase
LPGAERSQGFLRLWTLKEAFIKATGKGLTDDLASFWFEPSPPRIHFLSYLGENEGAWGFEQRLIDDGFIAAVGLRHGGPSAACWVVVDPAQLGPSGLGC